MRGAWAVLAIAGVYAATNVSTPDSSATNARDRNARATNASPPDWRPSYLDGLQLIPAGKGDTRIGTHVVHWQAFDEDALLVFPTSPGEIEQRLHESYAASMRVARALGAEPRDNERQATLYIVHLDAPTMDNDKRFGSWRDINGVHLYVLHGIYDPTPSVKNDAVLMYTEPDGPQARVLIHELGHYWYDRLRLGVTSGVSTERFAKAVEREWLMM